MLPVRFADDGKYPMFGRRAEQFHSRVAFEVKLLFIVCLLLSHPACLLLLMYFTPTVRYWVGARFVLGIFGGFLSVILGYVLLMGSCLRRNVAAILMVVLPSFLFAAICHLQEWNFATVSSALSSSDCKTFTSKAELEYAWLAAKDFTDKCVEDLVAVTGAPASETRNLFDAHSCPGYKIASKPYEWEWWYLEQVETRYRCGGWCERGPRLWGGGVAKDSCSNAVAIVMSNNIALTSFQVTVYSAIMLAFVCIWGLCFPKFFH
mmetsp:Transcript_82998/g.231628  ORF Transcript_82998/g.231628 Transcript_82998/m.231628 type:complete len:263 (+) Transcript_82998:114-902(+)